MWDPPLSEVSDPYASPLDAQKSLNKEKPRRGKCKKTYNNMSHEVWGLELMRRWYRMCGEFGQNGAAAVQRFSFSGLNEAGSCKALV